jgi:alpha-galactosidase
MNKKQFLKLLLVGVAAINTLYGDQSQVYFDDMDLSMARSAVDKPMAKADLKGKSMVVAGERFERGVTLHPPHNTRFILNGSSERFTARVGMDDDSKKKLKNGSLPFVRFVVLANGEVRFDEVVKLGQKAVDVSVDLSGVKELNLITEEPQKVHYNVEYQAVWANAMFIGGQPSILPLKKFILTPTESSAPRIHSPKIFGCRPGSPLHYTIATSGERPIKFRAKGLPLGVKLDAQKGRLSGSSQVLGDHKIQLFAENEHGEYHIELVLRVGDEISLTPPMGWNSWYCWSESVSQEKIEGIAHGFAQKGLVDYGWSYINVDDCWGGPQRGGVHHAIQGNERFPDMKGMVDTIHGLGMRAGLYSTLWMSSFGGFIGGTAPNAEGDYSDFHAPEDTMLQKGQIFGRCPTALKSRAATIGPYWFVDNDVKQFTEWGFDYVKYDWNERHNQEALSEHLAKHQKFPDDVRPFGVDEVQRKYAYWTRRFHDSFRASPRDMVLSLSPRSTYSSGGITSKYSNLWRTTNDIVDTWVVVSESFKNDAWRKFQRPGHWNDPDMLQVGNKGIPNKFVRTLQETRLTPDEQYTQMSLWSIMASPLLISCDIETMDAFTLNLLKNPEVISVSQDSLGLQGRPVWIDGDLQVWVRELSNGELAIGVFNLGYGTLDANIELNRIGMSGHWSFLDCWTHRDMGVMSQSFSAQVRGHGSVLLRAKPVKGESNVQ